MAIKGVSKFITADYSAKGEAVTYSNGVVNEHLVSYSAEIESSDDSELYADNRVVERENGVFKSGTLTVTTAGLSQETTESLFTIKDKTVTLPDGGSKTIKKIIYDDDTKSKAKGVGFIELHQVDNVDMYRAIVLNRVMFNIPANSATTKGESVEWQTPEISGTIMRSESVNNDENHPWKSEADCASEAEALAFIKYELNFTKDTTTTTTPTEKTPTAGK